MALKEGRCPNCGSILHLDPTAEKGHCLFCDAVFDNSQAFSIAADPKGVVFPNLPQPKYEGPSLSPRSSAAPGQQIQRKQQPQQAPKKPVEVKPAYVMKDEVKMPSFKLSGKTKLRIVAVIVIIVALAAAIAVPTILNRDAARAKLMAEMANIVPFDIDVSQDVSIGGVSNSYLLIVAAENVDKEDAVTLFKAYSNERAEVLGLSADDAGIYSQVTVKLVMPDGGWLIEKPASVAELDSGAAVETLNP